MPRYFKRSSRPFGEEVGLLILFLAFVVFFLPLILLNKDRK